MSQEEYLIFTEDQTEMLILLLSDNDFLDEKLDVEKIKTEIEEILGNWCLYHPTFNQTIS